MGEIGDPGDVGIDKGLIVALVVFGAVCLLAVIIVYRFRYKICEKISKKNRTSNERTISRDDTELAPLKDTAMAIEEADGALHCRSVIDEGYNDDRNESKKNANEDIRHTTNPDQSENYKGKTTLEFGQKAEKTHKIDYKKEFEGLYYNFRSKTAEPSIHNLDFDKKSFQISAAIVKMSSIVLQDTDAQKKKRISKIQLDRCISLFERQRKPHFCRSERRQSNPAGSSAPRSAEQGKLGKDTSEPSLDINHRTITTRTRTEMSARPATHGGGGYIAKGDSDGQQGTIGYSRVSRRSVVHSESNWKPQKLSSDGKKSAKVGSKYGKGQRTKSDHLHERRQHFHIRKDESHPDTAVTARRRSTPVDRRMSMTSGKMNDNSDRRTSGTVHPSQYTNTNRAQSRRPSSSKMYATNQKSAKSNKNKTEVKNIAHEANEDILQAKTQDAANATFEIVEGKRAEEFDSKTVSHDVVRISAYNTDNADHESSAYSDPKISDQPQQSDDDTPDNVVKRVTRQRWRRNKTENDPTKELNSSDSKIPFNTIPIKVKERKVGQTAPTAPSSFKLTSANTGKESTPKFFPSAQTNELSVSLLNETVLQAIDDHAIQVAKCEHRTVKDLVWDLIFSVKITDDLEKCRAIFRWLASKNLNAMSFDEVEAGSPEELLMGLKTEKTSYSKVFGKMCGYAGILATIVKGHAKHVEYLPGNKVQLDKCKSTWNAVCIYGHWCLIDVNWGARWQRRTFGKPATQEDLTYRLDEYYFLTNPAQFVFSHFPDDSEWQLLEDKMTLEEYETTPILRQSFFRYGFELVSHMKAAIHCRDEVTIRLRHEEPDLVCGFKILCDNGREDHDGVKLNEYGMLEQVEGLVFITLRLPRQGAYLLTSLAREEIQSPDEAANTKVCEYMVIQEEVTTADLEPFPYCPNSIWGPKPDFYRFGLETYQKKAVVSAEDERAEIQIRLPKVINVKACLKGNRYSKENLGGYCMTRLVENTLYVNITVPEKVEFALVVYSSNPLTDDSFLYPVAQYLIKCEKAVTADPWPIINGNYLGLRPKFVEFGLKVLSHPDPFIQLESNAVELQFKTNQTMNVTAKLLQNNTGKDLQQFSFMQQRQSVISFETTLPETGFYIFEMYALPANKDKKALPFVYSCLIKCNQLTQDTKPFPKQFSKWEEGCYLESPKTLHNQSGDKVLFRVRVPKALAVAVIVGQNWTYLECSDQEMWTGMISIVDHYGKDDTVKLSAKYNQNSTMYSTLLEYHIE